MTPTQQQLFGDQPTEILSVSEVTAQIKDLLEGAFPDVWVEAEISNFARPQSGHCYLTLKDDRAQLRAVIWRGVASRVRFDLHDGLEVVCRGHLDVYAPRGSYQLVVEQIEPKGMGALELALRQLKAKLAAEGLFDPDLKRPLPRFPRTVAFVTSPTGAAIRDFLEVLRRRWRGVRVLVIPTRVQGDGAAEEIAAGIRLANRLQNPPVDCLVVGRGGGSLEDLWAFNEEVVVRAVHASQIPTVSAVGHEIDVTLCDLVADVRALTPSEAAERVVPDGAEIAQYLGQQQRRLRAALRAQAAAVRAQLDALANSRVFRRPSERLHDLARRLDEFGSRASRAITHRSRHCRADLDRVSAQLATLSPQAVLNRGYSITRLADSAQPIRSASEVESGAQIVTRFATGETTSRVEQVEAGD